MADDEAVTTKARMYHLLHGGAFGNTIRQYFDVREWLASGEPERCPFWGVRTMTPGGPCRLYCPTGEVAETAREFGWAGNAVNISAMIDAFCTVTMWADVFEGEAGLSVYGVEYPGRGANWRRDMPTRGRQFTGVNARMVLCRHLNPSSLADLDVVLERFPGHVVELSAIDRCLGTIPGRNGVVWEVRRY
jgi:hypothetical protein